MCRTRLEVVTGERDSFTVTCFMATSMSIILHQVWLCVQWEKEEMYSLLIGSPWEPL